MMIIMLNRMDKTGWFSNGEVTHATYGDDIFNRVQRVYGIDDCDVTYTTDKGKASRDVQYLKSKYSPEHIKSIIDYSTRSGCGDICVLTELEYLKELKDAVQDSEDGCISIGSLSRTVVRVNARQVVCSLCVVKETEEGPKPYIVCEVYVDNKYSNTVEYLLSDLEAMMSGLSEPEPIMTQHNRVHGRA